MVVVQKEHRLAHDAGPDGLGCVLSREQRREHVVGAIQWAWKGYRNCSWGEDELMPISCGKNEWFGLGITLVDSLDTLMLAGLDTVRYPSLRRLSHRCRKEYSDCVHCTATSSLYTPVIVLQEVEEALVWIATELPDRLESRTSVSLFETTIRIIGGLLAAAHIKNDPVVSPQLLKPAAELSGAFHCAVMQCLMFIQPVCIFVVLFTMIAASDPYLNAYTEPLLSQTLQIVCLTFVHTRICERFALAQHVLCSTSTGKGCCLQCGY